jgi:hypothetical protein
MGTFAETALISAPVERVFDYRLDVNNLPHYNPDVSDFRACSEGTPTVGSTYEFRVKVAPWMRARVRLVITRIERPRLIEFEMRTWFRVRELCTFEPVEEGRTTRLRFETRVDTPGGPLAPLLDALFVVPLGRRQVARELALIPRGVGA